MESVVNRIENCRTVIGTENIMELKYSSSSNFHSSVSRLWQ